MKIKQLFTTVPLERFQDEVRSDLEALHHLLHNGSKGKEEYENLVQAFAANTDYVTSMIGLMELGSRVNPSPLEYLGFISAWLMDGGSLIALEDLFDLEKIGRRAYAHGAHHLLFHMGLKEPDFALKATCVLLDALYDYEHPDEFHKITVSQPISGRASLTGFMNRPRLRPSSENQSFQAYIHHHFPDGVTPNTLAPSSPTIVQELLDLFSTGCRDLPTQYFMLMAMIYNPGLRLKGVGFSCLQIVHHLQPVVTQIAEIFLEQAGQPFISNADRKTFEHQVWVNLFSPFPDDLACVNAEIHELSGYPGRWSKDTDERLLSTLQGPVALFTAERSKGVFEYYERIGMPLDLDDFFQGLLRDHSVTDGILWAVGRCKTTDAWLVRLVEEGPDNLELLTDLVSVAQSLDYTKLDEPAKVGYLALLLEKAKMIKKHDKLWKFTTQDPRSFLVDAPQLQAGLLDYMSRHDLLDFEWLDWCGYDSDILNKVTGPVSLDTKESYLCKDLGL